MIISKRSKGEKLDTSVARVFGLDTKVKQILANGADKSVHVISFFTGSAVDNVVIGYRKADQTKMYFLTSTTLQLRKVAIKKGNVYHIVPNADHQADFDTTLRTWSEAVVKFKASAKGH